MMGNQIRNARNISYIAEKDRSADNKVVYIGRPQRPYVSGKGRSGSRMEADLNVAARTGIDDSAPMD